MASFNPKRLIPLVVIGALVGAGYYVDHARAAHRSTLSGVFESQPSDLSSRIGGHVVKILVREGQVVKKGEPLIELEALATEAQTRAAEAQARGAKAQATEVRKGPREEDIRRQRAVVAEAQATLLKLKHGPLPEEIGIARQRLAAAQARMSLLRQGPRDEDIRAARASKDQAEASYRAAQRGPTEEERRQAEAAYQAVKVQADQARTDADRGKMLFDAGAISRSQWETAEARAQTAAQQARQAMEARDNVLRGTPRDELEVARQAYERAKAQFDALANGSRPDDIRQAEASAREAAESLHLLERGTRREDIAASEARLRQAESVLQALVNGSRPEQIQAADAQAEAVGQTALGTKSNYDDRIVAAPADGIVERILVGSGDLASPGMPVVRFANPQDIWLRVYIPEGSLAKVSVGDTAKLLIDGIDPIVEGVVESIATQGEFTPANLQTPEERGKQVFAVRIRLKTPDSRVKAGMAATVREIGALH